MTISDLWHRFAEAGPAAVVFVVATTALLALPVFQWLVPRGRRHRGRAARLFLVLAVLLALGAVGLGTMGAASPGNLLQLVGLLALTIGLLGVGILVVLDVMLPRLGIDVPAIIRDLILIVGAVAIGMGFLRLAGLDLFSLVTTSAVLTAVIGLALQSTIANVFGGLSLQLDRTLHYGEWIEVGDHVGRILEIGWRSTRIQTKDGDTVFVPNSELVSKEVRNFARPTNAHRMTLRVGFHYRHPPNEVRRVLLAAVREAPGVLGHPQPDCGPAEFGDSAVIYVLRYWIDDFASDTTIDHEVHARVWYAARRAGLEIPFPIRTLVTQHDTTSTRVADEDRERDTALRLLETAAPFDALDADVRSRCARGARRVEFAYGERIPNPGESEDGLYLIGTGEVAVRVGTDEASPGIITLRAGELLGRRVLPAHDRCTAQSDVDLYQLDRIALDEAVTADPRLGAGLAAIADARREAAERSAAAPVQDSALPRLRRLLGRR